MGSRLGSADHGQRVDQVASLLDRERELRALLSALAEAREESGQLVLIEGPAGLGKTSLLRASFDAASGMGFVVLRARASELERDFPYGCVRQLLEPIVARASAAERERLFDGAAALAMPLFAPRAPAAQPESSPDSVFSILHGLYWLLNNLTRAKPVALCVDDLQWSDTESLRFLGYLAPRLDGLALAVLATVRSHENVTADLAHLSGAPETKVLRPQPLSLASCAALCEQRLGSDVDADFAAACHGATGGNPFYLETLLREAQDRRFLTDAREAARVRRFGSGAVARAVLLRLSSAPASATTLVRAIAVLGDGASVTEAARLAELPEDEAVRAADLLVTLSILKQGEGWSSRTRSCDKRSMPISELTHGRGLTRARRRSWRMAALQMSVSPRSSRRRNRLAISRVLTSCAEWRQARCRAGHRPLRSRG